MLLGPHYQGAHHYHQDGCHHHQGGCHHHQGGRHHHKGGRHNHQRSCHHHQAFLSQSVIIQSVFLQNVPACVSSKLCEFILRINAFQYVDKKYV